MPKEMKTTVIDIPDHNIKMTSKYFNKALVAQIDMPEKMLLHLADYTNLIKKCNPMPTPATIEIKAYSISELSALYSISNKTMNRWLKPIGSFIGKREGRYYTALQVRIIFEMLGVPGTI